MPSPLACVSCSTLFSPIGTPHPLPCRCPQCSGSHRCSRCDYLGDEAEVALTDGRWLCVDAGGCDEHLAVWGEPGTDVYAEAIEP